ncbi:uncharacterized protein LOC112596640 [Melanaphis sacchari]|uniref:uncharacterized protein LOC112596640 n=1 Tax=Melanaphis sacchari TaxID=742174 RepID=UPI000DC1517C|nr:uncharacterized protein LOC112596640 [Melanaphis sacchari]
MKSVKKKEKRKVRSVKLQFNRLNEAIHSLCSEKNSISTNFENSAIGQEIKKLRKTIEDQYSIIGTFSVADNVKKLKEILDQNANNEIVERKLNERNMLIVELKELDMALITAQQEQEKISEQLFILEKERRVLAHLIASTYQEKNKDVVEQ